MCRRVGLDLAFSRQGSLVTQRDSPRFRTGKNNSAVVTLVERTSRHALVVPVPDGFGAHATATAVTTALARQPAHLVKTLASDQGREMTHWAAIEAALGIEVFFCDSHSPWQRPTNAPTTSREPTASPQNQTLGHRGHKHDPLYRARKLLLSGHERVTEPGEVKLLDLLDAGDPHSEVRNASHANQTLRGIYDIVNPEQGAATVEQLAVEFCDPSLPVEINRLGRTLWRWRTQIANWHSARVSNAATESANNLIKRVKRVAFGFTNFTNYRIRALLYAGKPNWALLDTLTPP
ncbi:MAG: IS30 family transposase [Acidimicrobiaceae bacterium]|nr:IS30 family transposase [Acidimicrobiaceae bacterium]